MAALLLAGLAGPAAAQETADIKGLDALVEQGLKDWQVPGLAVAVVKDGKLLLARGYGVRSLQSGEKVDADTSFYIGSASKSFTATLAAMLVDEGKASWDRPLVADVPTFMMWDPVATSRVTLRDMLSHRTGIPRQEFLKINAPDKRTDLIGRIRYFEPALEFRAGFRYSNEVVTVAGDLLAQQAGTTWEDLLRRRILIPLHMTRTAAQVREMQAAGNFAMPYILGDKAPEVMAFYDVSELRGPAGAVISTANDMANWLLFNLNLGKVNGTPVVRQQALSPLFTPQMPATLRAPRYPELSHQNCGLGWFIDTYRGSLRFSHPGNLYGFTAMVSFLPRESVGVVVLANLNGTPLPEIVERFVYDSLLNLAPVNWSGRYKDDEARARAAYEAAAKAGGGEGQKAVAAPPPHTPDEYAGTYLSAGYGTVTIARSGGGLSIRLRSGTFPLHHGRSNAFDFSHPVEGQSWPLVFREGLSGTIEAVAIEAGPGLQPLVFMKQLAAGLAAAEKK